MSTVAALAERLRAGTPAFTAWCGLPEPAVAGAPRAREPSTPSRSTCSTARSTSPRRSGRSRSSPPPASRRIARIPVGDFATASQLLDAGASAIIAPMINTVEDARRFGAFMKFPPLGERSWGPHARVSPVGPRAGRVFRAGPTGSPSRFAMVETREALGASRRHPRRAGDRRHLRRPVRPLDRALERRRASIRRAPEVDAGPRPRARRAPGRRASSTPSIAHTGERAGAACRARASISSPSASDTASCGPGPRRRSRPPGPDSTGVAPMRVGQPEGLRRGTARHAAAPRRRCRGRRRPTGAIGRAPRPPPGHRSRGTGRRPGSPRPWSPWTSRIGGFARTWRLEALRPLALLQHHHARRSRRSRPERRRPAQADMQGHHRALAEADERQLGRRQAVASRAPRRGRRRDRDRPWLTPRQRSCGSRKVRGNHCRPIGRHARRAPAHAGATKAASGSQRCHCRPISMRSLPSAP